MILLQNSAVKKLSMYYFYYLYSNSIVTIKYQNSNYTSYSSLNNSKIACEFRKNSHLSEAVGCYEAERNGDGEKIFVKYLVQQICSPNTEKVISSKVSIMVGSLCQGATESNYNYIMRREYIRY